MGPRLSEPFASQMKPSMATSLPAWGRSVLSSQKSEETKPSSPSNVKGMVITSAYMLLNFASSVAIIWCNKLAYEAGFEWPISLTAIHFLFTFIGLFISARCGLFNLKPIGVMQVLPISAAFCGFVVFNNLSLQLNSVGVYQLLKVMTTPCIVVLEFALYSQRLPIAHLLALVPICLGVPLATGSSTGANFYGLAVGVFGIVSTSLYQIWVKRKQDSLKCTSAQLLSYQAPLSAIMLLAVVPFFEPFWTTTTMPFVQHTEDGSLGNGISDSFLSKNDPPHADAASYGTAGLTEATVLNGLFDFNWHSLAAFWVLTSAVLSFLVNLSIFLVIKRTSALSYNVLGHAKLCTILVSGYLFFDKQTPAAANVAGVVLTIFGVVAYTHLKLKSSGSKPAQKELPSEAAKMDVGCLLPPVMGTGGKPASSSSSSVAKKDDNL